MSFTAKRQQTEQMIKGPKKRLLQATAILFATSPVTAVTQSAPMMETVPVTYTGLAMDWFADSIRIVQPDGSLAEYTGPIPNLPLGAGDTVSFTFNVNKPRGISFDTTTYKGQVAADGTYKIAVNQNLDASGATWQVVGGGAVQGNGGSAMGNGTPPKASYSVAYDSATGETEVEQGEVAMAAAETSLTPMPLPELAAAPAAVPEQAQRSSITWISKPPATPVDPVVQPIDPLVPPVVDETPTPAVSLPFVPETISPGTSEGPPSVEPAGPTPVPAPGGLLLLAAALGLLPLRKRLTARA